MPTNAWEVNAYPDARYEADVPPKMIYLPSVELIQKMILASAKNKYGKIVNDANDILERFISTEVATERRKVRRVKPKMNAMMKEKTDRFEKYANENEQFKDISEFDKCFKPDADIDLSTLAQFIPAHKTSKQQKEVREYLWNLIDDNGNGLLSLSECRMGLFSYFKDHPALAANEQRHKLVAKAFNLAKDFYPCTAKKSKKKKKVSLKDKFIERGEFRIFLIALR